VLKVPTMARLRVLTCLFLVSCAALLLAKETPIVLLWPQDKPALKLTFDKFRQLSSYAGQNTFVADVTVQNLTDKPIPHAVFTVYLSDKTNVRIGDAVLQVSDLNPGQIAKLPFQFNAVGIPANLAISAKKDMLAGKTVSLTIISVPPGADLKVDGHDSGRTPALVKLAVGTHTVDLAKEGYAPGSTPVEITTDELPGGSITIELGGLSRDTVELRDGTSVVGDVMSLSMTSVVVRVNGTDQTYDRNKVKKIILVERQVVPESAVVQPASASQK
jgi:hypothetical protein